jgi:hypothetical protein
MRLKIHPFTAICTFLACLAVLLSACTKTEEVIIDGNTPPPDETIDNITVESYINRTYIRVLGRKPDSIEFEQGNTTLRVHNLSTADREAFVDQVTSDPGFYQHTFDAWRSYLLDNTDTTEIREFITLFDLLQTNPDYAAIWDVLATEEARLRAVLAIPADLAAGLAMSEMHKRLTNNYIYDNLNMGSQNFVISHFQNLLLRYPTESELLQGEAMVNGIPAFLFLESGKSRDDFLNIFYASTDYQEGQVVILFNDVLFRDPDSREMVDYTASYDASGDYKALLRSLLITNEFIGL